MWIGIYFPSTRALYKNKGYLLLRICSLSEFAHRGSRFFALRTAATEKGGNLNYFHVSIISLASVSNSLNAMVKRVFLKYFSLRNQYDYVLDRKVSIKEDY